MDDITALTQINFSYTFLSVFIILIGFKTIFSLIEWFVNKFGIETKRIKEKRENHDSMIKTAAELSELQEKHKELVRQDLGYVKAIKQDINNLTKSVNDITQTLSDMRTKENETKLKELKSSLVRYYNKYKVIGEWSKLESEAFWDLFSEYEERGGDGYVHSIIEPVMRELREVD